MVYEIKGTGILWIIYLKRFINGSIIAFIATPRPAIATKKAVIFSIYDLILEVDGWSELNNFCFICANIFFTKVKISINLEIK